MPRFLIDAQLPPGLAKHLNECGFAAEHVNRIGLGHWTDRAIWDYARNNAATLITKDEDFIALSKRNPTGPQVIWIRLGNISNDALWRALSIALNEIIAALEAGDRIVEVI